MTCRGKLVFLMGVRKVLQKDYNRYSTLKPASKVYSLVTASQPRFSTCDWAVLISQYILLWYPVVIRPVKFKQSPEG